MKEKIGIIGLGVIGNGVAKQLLKKGYEVFVYNRTKKKATNASTLGAKIVDKPSELAQNTDIIFIAVWDYLALKEVTEGINGIFQTIKKNQVIIDLSSQLPETAKWQEKLYESKKAFFLDAPVHGSKKEAEEGSLWMLIGGQKTVYKKVVPLLRSISKDQYYMGPVGSGCIAKLCGNLIAIAIVGSVCESLVLAKKAGLDLLLLSKVWEKVDFRSPLINGLVKSILKRDFAPSFHLRTMVKDTNLIRELSESLNMPLLISPIIHELYKIGLNKGYGEENASALVKVFEDISKTKII